MRVTHEVEEVIVVVERRQRVSTGHAGGEGVCRMEKPPITSM